MLFITTESGVANDSTVAVAPKKPVAGHPPIVKSLKVRLSSVQLKLGAVTIAIVTVPVGHCAAFA
jgi:hypothetical protein